MKKLVIILSLAIVFSVVILLSYVIGINPVDKNGKDIQLEIKENSTYLSIASQLKENNLIKSEIFYKVYIRLNKPNNLQVGVYNLNQSMGVKEIVEFLEKGSNYNPNIINITFKEGINMRGIIKLIENNTNNTSEDVYKLLSDEEYLNGLIDKYWFIDESVKKQGIYYSLEGYLFPDTYEIDKNNAVKEIFSKMLDKMDSVLSNYKEDIENSDYTVHEILTLSSIVELEASNSDDRNGVAGVFYNRLNNNWSLGSDVTTYYAAKIDVSERDLYMSEINDVNDYNTRPSQMAGKLPIGPICIPGKESIEATINPSKHEYFFFVADKNKKTYFNKTYDAHNTTINKLIKEDLWFQY